MPLPSGVATDVLGAYRREYAELSDNWARVETKAQGTAVVAGALLSATVALLTSERYRVPLTLYVFFPIIGLMLLTSAYLSWEAVKISDNTIPSPGDQVRDFAIEAHAQTPGPTYQTFRELALEAQIESWSEACADLQAEIARKAEAVLVAQRWLFVAGGFAMLFVVWYTFAIVTKS